MKAGKGYFEFCQEYTLVIEKHSSNKTREDSTHGHYQMVNTEIRLNQSLQPKMQKLYTVSKNKMELTMAQIMNSLLPNSD